jgi:hypothetical protein
VLHAIRFARDSGRPINTHVTVSFAALGIEDAAAGPLFQDLQSRLARWWRYKRATGLVSGALLGVHSHANPAGSRHVHWLAAATLRLDRWEAGARLMQNANPQGWAQVAVGAKLERENRPALEDCWRAATRTGKAQRCIVTVAPIR